MEERQPEPEDMVQAMVEDARGPLLKRGLERSWPAVGRT